MKVSYKIGASVVGLLIIILLGLIFISSNQKVTSKDETVGVNFNKLDEVVFDVKTEKVQMGDLVQYISANGVLRGNKEIDITSNISSLIDSIFIYEGKFVNKNDLMIKLDDREYQLALSDAEVKVTDARVEYGFLNKEASANGNDSLKAIEIQTQIVNLDKDFKAGKISEHKYTQMKDELDMKLIFTGAKREEVVLNKSGLTAAINSYKRAKLNYAYTRITAPFEGVIANFDLTPGMRINTGEKLFKLIDNSTLKIDVGVLESDIPKIKLNNLAEINITVFPGEIFLGKVTGISPMIDPETKTCKVTVELKNTTKKILPGMFANIKIETDRLPQSVLIPKAALLSRDRRNLVFTVENGLAKWKYIDIAEQNDDFIKIKAGVKAGEEVIVDGHYTLAHDSKVRVLNN
jgi:membrane fusion protein, multidrug efflux system